MKQQLIIFLSLIFLSSYYSVEIFANDKQVFKSSKRIQVYSVSQNFWDVKSGDTLGNIIKKLTPDNPATRDSLSQQIIHLNPNAFILGDANKLKANVRIWLPNGMPVSLRKNKKDKYEIRSFSWGQAYKIKR